MADKQPIFTNHLKNEKSPYLVQHAHNPVDWYPWGQEAFEKAKKEDKPIFLSIGYASCHWCHVMEEEAFSDEDVGRALNRVFVAIKVDREELPEVDRLYMEFSQAMVIGSGGWPLNVILTPDLKPFFAMTYMPKHTNQGIVGVLELTAKIEKLWDEDRERIETQAEKLFAIIQHKAHLQGKDLPSEEAIEETAEILFKISDPIWGGLKGAPKFPLGYQATFLFNYYLRSHDARALFLVEKTFDMMHRGAIYDHLGGGFCRYSVDDKWQRPHFEKMLYDNAVLATNYVTAYRVTGRDMYARVAEEICEYLLSTLQSPEGGFYTSEDSDSKGVEGLFYTWTEQEIIDVLGRKEAEYFLEFYGITDEGDFHDRSLLYKDISEEEYASIRGISEEEFDSYLASAKEKLFKAREKRPHPEKDEKIVTAYNGLAIHALTLCGLYLDEKRYIEAALDAASFIRKQLYKEGRLLRRFCHEEGRFDAILDDYACLIQGLLTLFEAGCGNEWLTWAVELQQTLDENFKAPDGAYYVVDTHDPSIIIRKSHFSDGAEPSGIAIEEENLLRLYEITGNIRYREAVEDCFKALNRYLTIYPLGYCYHLIALQRYYDMKKVRISVFLNEKEDAKREIVEALTHKVFPHIVTIFRNKNDGLDALLNEIPKKEYPQEFEVDICREGKCLPPMSKKDALSFLKEL